MCVDCHKEKTREDRKKIAKVNRLRKRERGQRSRTRRGRMLPSRPFPKKET